jgi:hypothetical protein
MFEEQLLSDLEESVEWCQEAIKVLKDSSEEDSEESRLSLWYFFSDDETLKEGVEQVKEEFEEIIENAEHTSLGSFFELEDGRDIYAMNVKNNCLCNVSDEDVVVFMPNAR